MAAESSTHADADRMFCYRHPERETWLRCGRCERPICTGCAMQGPVGSRCRQCGKPAHDPLTSFTPIQLATGATLALGGGLVSGLAGAVGILGLCVALFAGGLVAETARRRIGYKQGPVFGALVFGGLMVGALAGYALIYGGLWLPAGAALVDGDATLALQMLLSTAGWALLIGAVACFGAYTRLR